MPRLLHTLLFSGAICLLMGPCVMAKDGLQPVPMTLEERQIIEEAQMQRATQQRCAAKAVALHDSLSDTDRRELQAFSDQHYGFASGPSSLLKTLRAGQFAEAETTLKRDYKVNDALATRLILFAAYGNSVEAACPKEVSGGTSQTQR